ncbi:DNA replication complex GINS protein PSF1 [Monocercomonoides exilis]|uniref:DNA replication complex GINS protein PSF1 n=1 Tax=Monocercomonoides exilis TaxID=2049356 RepID=UPI0035594D64|nr:DNA replication complex GINS protein PSF1 [Monocercomonoides exilis]|eukprot:MONOS_12807.1-p1 / transcript=MONOS_12807.1 / gene=MONOS_12807 / organism=Monocercomonoides_exilis_PA203 / gene_product=DNA replication complex GINS protein PSF1 / transcript_product=DNA replication complex GINS protein PSF1 / location=Mono_scaffold00735:24970-25671(+) / protein_length=196 / sequence_SO=supercontig / SO=protein_coding / is_pseudo=false
MSETKHPGVILLQELQRVPWLPRYDDQNVKEVKQILHDLVLQSNQMIKQLKGAKEEERKLFDPYFVIIFTRIQQNRRILQAYFDYRMRRIQLVKWEIGYLPEHLKGKLHSQEERFYRQYSQIVVKYCESLGDLELTNDIFPPKSVTVCVRALKTMDSVIDHFGKPMDIQKDSQMSMNKIDAEPLIRQGVLEHLPT